MQEEACSGILVYEQKKGQAFFLTFFLFYRKH